MENNKENLPVVPKKGFKEQVKSLLNKIMDFLFTNHSEGIVVAEFDEYGREIKRNLDVEETNEDIEVEFDDAVVSEEKEIIYDSEVKVEIVNEFDESLKVDLQTYNEKTLEEKRIEFIDELEEHPESLINLSMDRLKKIEEYYDELIADLDRKIEEHKKVS